ncbi:hypothetical protein VPH49_20335 [Pseudomonas luteola]|uniref:hypothetical protein n=1 Tax=Pseudomonas luteola TaxID=47886 RepID=UPI003A8BD935
MLKRISYTAICFFPLAGLSVYIVLGMVNSIGLFETPSEDATVMFWAAITVVLAFALLISNGVSSYVIKRQALEDESKGAV